MFSLTKSASVLQSFFTDKKQVIEEYILKKGIKRGEQGKLNVYRKLFIIMRDT